MLLAAFVALYKHEQLAKNLTQVSPINLINHKEVVIVTVDFSGLTEVVKGSTSKFKSSV